MPMAMRKNVETRVSVFNGPPPLIKVCETLEEEKKTVSEWIGKLSGEGLRPDEIECSCPIFRGN